MKRSKDMKKYIGTKIIEAEPAYLEKLFFTWIPS